jgi:hypothetical protein
MNRWRDRSLSWEERAGALLTTRFQDNGLCREWVGAAIKRYGMFRMDGKNWSVPRVAWMLAHGPIPKGMYICHHCDNPPCFQTEPDAQYPEGHLFLGTPGDNIRDAIGKGRKKAPSATGEANPRHKLSDAEVAQIRSEYRQGDPGGSGAWSGTRAGVLAARYGVTARQIRRIGYGLSRTNGSVVIR